MAGLTHGGAWPDIASTEPDLGFHETDLGLVYKAFRKTKKKGKQNYREHHLLMPGISCGGSGGRYLEGRQGGTPVSAARWSVPIDETHTILFRARLELHSSAAEDQALRRAAFHPGRPRSYRSADDVAAKVRMVRFS